MYCVDGQYVNYLNAIKINCKFALMPPLPSNIIFDQQPQPSAFAQMVDQLRSKSEAELKMLYLQFFKNDLITEWSQITESANFENVAEDDIVKAIQLNRYKNHV